MNIPMLARMNGRIWAALLSCVVTVILSMAVSVEDSRAEEVIQKRFPSPEAAVQALVAASRGDDLKTILAILGPDSEDLISSGDSVADNLNRDKFVAAYEQKQSLEARTTDTMILHIGADDWTMPIPIVKQGNSWGFDIAEGKQEILNRRIGRNELYVIDVIDAYVAAQHEYASKDCRGDGKVEFAQRFISSPGSRDGLYWEASEGEEQSPLGPLIARAAQEGYATEDNLSPFHGYYFRILTEQGKHAAGGAYQYVDKGKMILGFALVAYPAEYGNSGVMTFMVNQEGMIFEKDLGENTRSLAEAIVVYNPDESWKKVEDLEPATPGSCEEGR
ncbi:MAG: DUF2950 domain-containing protein [Desulfuromonadales bacterium]|nr:DUF2950 domain-containing protein [Desulfuromonadales bacterium]